MLVLGLGATSQARLDSPKPMELIAAVVVKTTSLQGPSMLSCTG